MKHYFNKFKTKLKAEGPMSYINNIIVLNKKYIVIEDITISLMIYRTNNNTYRQLAGRTDGQR